MLVLLVRWGRGGGGHRGLKCSCRACRADTVAISCVVVSWSLPIFHVGSTNTPFRLRFNNCKACYRRFRSLASVSQTDFFRHFSEEGHHGLVEDFTVTVIDKLIGRDRTRECF